MRVPDESRMEVEMPVMRRLRATGIDWEAIEKEFDSGEVVVEDDEIVVQIYLGSVLSLVPSGKYYAPFACSNLAPCPYCQGQGCESCGHNGSFEARMDELWFETLERECDEHDCYYVSGEMDPCDLFLCRSQGVDQTGIAV